MVGFDRRKAQDVLSTDRRRREDQITRTGAMGNGAVDAIWAIETTFSSAWSDPRVVMPYGFVGRARGPQKRLPP